MKLKINHVAVSVAWEDNEATEALLARIKEKPIQIDAQRYGQFEQVGKLPFTLPQNNEQQTVKPGDIMLYQGENFVVFYGTHAWSYTKLGSIQGLNISEIAHLLDRPDAQIEIIADV